LAGVVRIDDQAAVEAIEGAGESAEVCGGALGKHVDVVGAVALAVGLDRGTADQHEFDALVLQDAQEPHAEVRGDVLAE